MARGYLSFSDYVQAKFGEKVYKLPIDAGFTCPNISGEKGRGGCVYCRNKAFKPFYLEADDSLEQQVKKGKEIFERKGAEKFLIYFQPHTNTNAPLEELRDLYEKLLGLDSVLGACIGTRPDCLGPEVVDLLGELSSSGYEIWVEIGQQTVHDRTLDRINRGHGFAAYRRAHRRLRQYPDLNICPHVIFGLPGETKTMMEESVDRLVELGLDGIKFHHLQVIRGTPLARTYCQGDYEPLTYDTYRSLVISSLKQLPAETVIHRLLGEAPRELLLAPHWETNKHEFKQEIEAALAAEAG